MASIKQHELRTDPRTGPRSITIVSHTHWDRAWYVTFQEFRARLVRLVDRLIEVLENDPSYHVFMLDGQMAVLEDYLEVRPQRKDELIALCNSGRLKVGPWYVLADEFLVHPEALIRNMQLGHRMGEEYGGVSKIGYVPDGFGHIAQLPQILRGFGIDNAFFWRGLGEESDRLGTEFMWKAPNGAAVTTVWMPYGYHIISNLGYPIHWGDTSQMMFDNELALEQIQAAIHKLESMTNIDTLLLMNGIDHEEVDPRLPEIIQLANERLKPYQFMHGTLENHLSAVRSRSANLPESSLPENSLSEFSLPEFSGEFRWGKHSEILQGVYATRIHLKQSNHRVETLYVNYAEPLAALASLTSANVPDGTQDLLWTGWRWLLKNHPHDDIYGSGIDRVHEEMDYRFSQAEQIGEVIVRDNLRQLSTEIDFSAQPGMPVLVFNPLGWEREEMVIGDLDFEFDDPDAINFRIVDANGVVIPHQVLGDHEVFWMETLKANHKRRIRLTFPVQVPAAGYQTFFVLPGRSPGSNPSLEVPDWEIRKDGAANRFLSFHLNPDGSLNILDKQTGAKFDNLAFFEDVEDCGDEYSFCPLPNSTVITSLGNAATTRLLVEGCNQVTFEINHLLLLPAGLAEDRQERSSERVEMEITTRITLFRDQPGLFLETKLDNQAKDHKLSVVFPTGLDSETAFVDQPFMVIERPIALPDSKGWVEDPTPLLHQRAFTDISTGSMNRDGIGLAIFNRGLPAVEVKQNKNGTRIDLILLRSVGWLSRDDLWNRRIAAGPLVPTPGAQCPGKYRFEYAVFPHAGTWIEGRKNSVIQAAYGYNTPLLMVRADTHEGLDLHEMNITRDDPDKVRAIPFPRGGKLPVLVSFFSLDRPELSLSSLHRPTKQIINPAQEVVLRYVNMSSTSLIANLRSYLPVREAWQIDLNEEPVVCLDVIDSHMIEFPVGGYEIVSLLLCMD